MLAEKSKSEIMTFYEQSTNISNTKLICDAANKYTDEEPLTKGATVLFREMMLST